MKEKNTDIERLEYRYLIRSNGKDEHVVILKYFGKPTIKYKLLTYEAAQYFMREIGRK